jgi:hypothetical protein
MGITVDMHVVAPVFLLLGERQPEPAMLGLLAGLDRLVDETGHDIIDSIRQETLHGVPAGIILAGCRSGEIELQCAPANDFRIVVKTVDDENGDVHFRAEE